MLYNLISKKVIVLKIWILFAFGILPMFIYLLIGRLIPNYIGLAITYIVCTSVFIWSLNSYLNRQINKNGRIGVRLENKPKLIFASVIFCLSIVFSIITSNRINQIASYIFGLTSALQLIYGLIENLLILRKAKAFEIQVLEFKELYADLILQQRAKRINHIELSQSNPILNQVMAAMRKNDLFDEELFMKDIEKIVNRNEDPTANNM